MAEDWHSALLLYADWNYVDWGSLNNVKELIIVCCNGLLYIACAV